MAMGMIKGRGKQKRGIGSPRKDGVVVNPIHLRLWVLIVLHPNQR
jgi:hypothetical protein